MRVRLSRLTASLALAAGLTVAGTAFVTAAPNPAADPTTPQAPSTADGATATQLAALARNTPWTEGARVPLKFDTYHPQGMVHVGDHYFMTSVQILQPTVHCNPACGGYDRTPGAGIGHVFEFDAQGNLLHDLTLHQDNMYHAGGLDYDGRYLYVPLAEYRPHSHAIVYRVDPTNWTTSVVTTVNDHIGSVTVDPVRHRLIGGNWGSRNFYSWNNQGQVVRVNDNPEQFIDYQDCHNLVADKMVCGGIAEFPINGKKTELGGLALIGLKDLAVTNTVPFSPTSPGGHVGTRNPIWAQSNGNRLELQVVADDDTSVLQTFDTPPLS